MREVQAQHQALVAQEKQFSDLRQQVTELVELNRQMQAALLQQKIKQASKLSNSSAGHTVDR